MVMIALALHLNACRSVHPILWNTVSIQNLGTEEWLRLARRVLEVSGFAVTLNYIFINILRKPVVISGQFEVVCMLVNKGCITWHLLKTHSAAGEQLYIELKMWRKQSDSWSCLETEYSVLQEFLPLHDNVKQIWISARSNICKLSIKLVLRWNRCFCWIRIFCFSKLRYQF